MQPSRLLETFWFAGVIAQTFLHPLGVFFHCVTFDTLLKCLAFLSLFLFSTVLLSQCWLSHTFNLFFSWMSYCHAMETSLHKHLSVFLRSKSSLLHIFTSDCSATRTAQKSNLFNSTKVSTHHKPERKKANVLQYIG